MASPLPPHWRYAPEPQYVDGDWVYAEDPASHVWDWRPAPGATPAGSAPPAPPATAPHGFTGAWPPTPAAAAAGALAGHWRYVPTPAQPDRWEYVDGDWVYAQDPATGWGWTWTGGGTAPAAPGSPPPSAYPTYVGTWPPVVAPAAAAAAWPAGPGTTGPAPGLPAAYPAPAGAAGAGVNVNANARSRHNWPLIALVAVLALALLFGVIRFGFGIGGPSGYVGVNAGNPGAAPGVSASAGVNGSTDNATPAASASAGASTPAAVSTASAAPVVANVGTHCNDTLSLPSHYVTMQQHPPADSDRSRAELMAASNGGAKAADYAGDAVDPSAMVTWLHDAHCDGMFGWIEVPNWYLNGNMGNLIHTVDRQGTLLGYVVGMNDLHVDCTDMQACANKVASVIQQIRSAGSNKPVVCLLDNMPKSQADMFTRAGCARHVFVFLPWKRSTHSDLQVSQLTSVGALAQSKDGDQATVGIQMFDWNDDPADADALGMVERGTPPPGQVGHMFQLAQNGGATNPWLISMEKKNNGDEDDMSYVQRCNAAVAALVH